MEKGDNLQKQVGDVSTKMEPKRELKENVRNQKYCNKR